MHSFGTPRSNARFLPWARGSGARAEPWLLGTLELPLQFLVAALLLVAWLAALVLGARRVRVTESARAGSEETNYAVTCSYYSG